MIGAAWAAVALSLILMTAGLAEAACSRPEIERAAQQVREARHTMRDLPVLDGLETDLPPEAQPAIATIKARLGEFVDAYMHCASTTNADAKRFERELLDLARGKDTDSDSSDEDRYGGRANFAVRLTGASPLLASIVASFPIHCGSDAVLYVFARQDDDWREALRWQSNNYPTVAGAFWSFDYAISPPDGTGGWFVVAKNVAPWCSSSWSEIRYSVLRPTPAAAEPAELFRASHAMWWAGDDFGSVSVHADGFVLRYHGESKKPDKVTRPYVRRFRVSGNRVTVTGR